MRALTQSYVHGASPLPLWGDTIGRVFRRTVLDRQDGEALVVPHQGVRWTWRELARRVDAVAAGLLAMGLEPGQRVGLLSPNNAEWIVTQLACASAGLILVNINPAYRLPELERALVDVGCAALVVAPRFKTSDYLAMLAELAPELDGGTPGALRLARLPDLRLVVHLGPGPVAGMLPFDELATRAGPGQRARLAELGEQLQFDDPINIQFTSGTTGSPKAATLSHHNVVNNALFAGHQMAFTSADRLAIPVPMYHCFGMVLGSLLCVVHGATMVLPCEGFDPAAVLDAVEAERCTALHGVPTMFLAELEQPDFADRDLSSLRTGIIAGAPCPAELMRRLQSELHLEQITIAYGMTETGPVSFQTAIDDSVLRRVETVGRVLPHTEVKLVDDHGRVVPTGTPGELLTRGYCVMPRYWGDPERTRQAIDEAGWIRSGDLATLDEHGYCRIVGRLKDMLIRGGENIYPREIEEQLYAHPAIEEVEVIGVPDSKYGEEVCAWVKLRAGASLDAEALRAWCQGRMAHFKIPRYVRFVDEFPMTITGKVQKYVMREIMQRELEPAASGPA